MEKTTGELLTELCLTSCEIDDFLEKNEKGFIDMDIKALWEKMIEKSKLSKSNIINKSDVSYAFFYDIINGRKMPSRDKIIRLVLAMHLPLEDCQALLKAHNKSPLYVRNRRDSILIFAVEHQLSVYETSQLLEKEYEACLK